MSAATNSDLVAMAGRPMESAPRLRERETPARFHHKEQTGT
jgi:hypothetical protein